MQLSTSCEKCHQVTHGVVCQKNRPMPDRGPRLGAGPGRAATPLVGISCILVYFLHLGYIWIYFWNIVWNQGDFEGRSPSSTSRWGGSGEAATLPAQAKLHCN